LLLETGLYQASPEARGFLFDRLVKDDFFQLRMDFKLVKDV